VKVLNNVTIKDIAKEAGVSTATVSRVLSKNGYASDDVRDRVALAVKRLNYQPNAIARSLKKDRTNTIGVVIPDIANPYFMQISKGIEDTVYQSGYNLIFGSGDENSEKERKILKVLFEQRVDAIVLATSGENEDLVNQIREANVPIILVDRKIEDQLEKFDLVVEDNTEAAYQLTKNLIALGHTKIGVVNGSLNVSVGVERFEGYRKAMKEHTLSENPELVYNGHFTQEDGVNAVHYFSSLEEKPTAILSFNNAMTFGILLQLCQSGFEVSKDFVIASYGEVEAAKLLTQYDIVSANQFPYEMGISVGEILLDRLVKNVKGPIQKVFSPNSHPGQ
jgi:LacI family transcriptional regulator